MSRDLSAGTAAAFRSAVNLTALLGCPNRNDAVKLTALLSSLPPCFAEAAQDAAAISR